MDSYGSLDSYPEGVRRIWEITSDFYKNTVQDVKQDPNFEFKGILLLIGGYEESLPYIWIRNSSYFTPIFESFAGKGREYEWADERKLVPLLKEMGITRKGGPDRDSGIWIDPGDGYRLRGVGVYVNRPDLSLVENTIAEIEERIKMDAVNGRHIAAAFYSNKTDGTSLVGSESGRSMISLDRGLIAPDYTIYRPWDSEEFRLYSEGLEEQRIVSTL